MTEKKVHRFVLTLASLFAFLIIAFLLGSSARLSPSVLAATPDWTDEFTAMESRWAWEYNRGTGYKQLTSLAEAPSAVEIGITSRSTSNGYSDCSLHEDSPSYTTGILEMRLRTTDDNGISQPGQGTRGWGFWDGNIQVGNAAWFWSASPESDPQLAGFRAQVVQNGNFLVNKTLSNIDMRQWHVYRIELSTTGTKFFVDVVQVASSSGRPANPQRAELWIDNYRIRLTESCLQANWLPNSHLRSLRSFPPSPCWLPACSVWLSPLALPCFFPVGYLGPDPLPTP